LTPDPLKLKLLLDHALYEFVDFFAQVACLAACTEALFGFSLEALAWRTQLENRLHVRQLLELGFAACYGFGELVYRRLFLCVSLDSAGNLSVSSKSPSELSYS